MLMLRFLPRGLPLFALALVLGYAGHAESQEADVEYLVGEIDSNPRWGSGWLDLATVIDFKRGDRLRLQVGGTAKKVVVRLLARGQSPDSSGGTVGGPVTVPDSRIIELSLPTGRKGVIQISVHGGSNPWGKYPLGADNGPATLESAELIRSASQ